jgi:hypothetical protein
MSQEITPFRHRHDGWTADRQALFLERLAETGSIRAACEGAGLTKTSAYRAYGRMPEFARAWDEALAARRPMLEEAAFERAVHGVTVPLTRYGEVVGERRRYSDGLLRFMIERGDKVATQAPPVPEGVVLQGQIDAALLRRLDALADARAPKREAAARQRWAELVWQVEQRLAAGEPVAAIADAPPVGWGQEEEGPDLSGWLDDVEEGAQAWSEGRLR